MQSVERAAALLRAVRDLSGPDTTATALAETVGLNRTTTWRILATLEQERLVRLDRGTGGYTLGFGARRPRRAGRWRVPGAGQRAPCWSGSPGQTGETAALAVHARRRA